MNQELQIALTEVRARQGKISNNLLKFGADMYVPEFTIPITEVMLTREQLGVFLGDPYAFNAWYQQRGEVWEPCTWWSHSKGEFTVDDAYVAELCQLKYSGDVTVEFKSDERDPNDKDAEITPACRISTIKFIPRVGGLTEMRFHLHVRPSYSKENLVLQEHQNRPLEISVGAAKLVQKGKQQELELNAPAAKPVEGTKAVMMGQPVANALPTENIPAVNPNQGEPNKGQEIIPSIPNAEDPGKCYQGHMRPEENSATEAHSLEGNSNTSANDTGQEEVRSQASDDLAPEKSSSASLIGDTAAASHQTADGGASPGINGVAPVVQAAQHVNPDGSTRPCTPEELAELEAGARKHVEAFTARPGHVVDGTTSRARKARAAAH